MNKRYPILLLITFAAAVWCVGQVTPPAGGPANPPSGGEPLAGLSSAGSGSQPDAPGSLVKGSSPLTDQRRDEVLAFLKAEQPKLYKDLENVKPGSPQRYAAMLGEIEQKVRFLMTLKASDPQLYGYYKEEMKISQEIDRLRTALTANPEPSKESELREQLREQLVARFDLVQDRQKRLIAQFKQHMEKLQFLWETRQANRPKIIEDQLNQILDQAHHQPPGSAPSASAIPAASLTAALFVSVPGPASQPGQ